MIAQAQSGTGKTATFAISILQRIDTSLRECQALVLAPTRELAQQIQKVILALGDFMNIECHACIGGTKVQDDLKKLEGTIILFFLFFYLTVFFFPPKIISRCPHRRWHARPCV